jgi:hypothetical protein
MRGEAAASNLPPAGRVTGRRCRFGKSLNRKQAHRLKAPDIIYLDGLITNCLVVFFLDGI